ncbi:MAG: hypothetical protein J6M31_06325 [Bacteroidales bacterium]|nr:hypothetical protein [Bacteroidales bacterium]
MSRLIERKIYRAVGEGDYHFCTDGLSGGLLFNTQAEYSFGMFLMGLICIKFSIRIYAFTLMPNHIHIILHGTGENCVLAFDFLKRKLSARLKRDGYGPLPDNYWFMLTPIDSELQLRQEFIYVLRNPLEQGLCAVGGYQWSSEWLYYSNFSTLLQGTPVSQISKRSLKGMLGGEDELPGHWLVHPEIGLLPGSFVDVDAVRALFPHPKDLQIALVKDYEVFYQIASRLGELTKYSKSELESIVSQTLQQRFSGKTLRMLSEEDKGKLMIILHREFGMNSYQISTTIYVKEKIVRQFLGSKELR